MCFWLPGVSARWCLREGSSASRLEGRGVLEMGNRACVPMVGQAKRGALGDFWGLCIQPSSRCLTKTSKAHSSLCCQRQAFTAFLQRLLPRWGRFPGGAGNRSHG